jgi:ribosomal protein S18 acetylase RimI-like enzyme
MPIEIRPMTPHDFGQVYELGCRSWSVADVPYNFWSMSEVADHLENHSEFSFVAVDGERVVGFVLGSEQYECAPDLAHLEWIAVDRAHRRQGIAARLVDTVLSAFRKCGRPRVMADVSSKNNASQETFRHLGFREELAVSFFVKDLERR